jgi:hypothetical protein
MTRPSPEQYYKKHRPPPNSCSGRRTSTSPPMNVPKTSLEERSRLCLRHDATQTSKLTSAGRRGLSKKFMPLDHPFHVPEGHPAEASEHWTTSLMARRLVPVPQGHASYSSELQRFQALRREWLTLPTSTTSPSTRRTRRTSTTSATGRGRRRSVPTCRWRGQRHLRRTRVTRKQEAVETQRSPDTGGDHQCSRPVSMVRAPDHLHSGGSMAQLRSSGQVPSSCRSGDPREQGKKGVSGRGSSINVTFPRTLLGLGVTLKELHEPDTPFFDIVPTEGEYPLGHIYMPVTFGTLENYRTEFLRFEVASFDCGYNTIIDRPRLAKFMAIPDYSYMILKMPGSQGIIIVRADFQGTAECFRVAIQAALTTKPPTTSSAQANSKPEEDLVIPANEAQAMASMRPTEETKRINLGFADERKTAIISSSLNDK